MRKIVVLLTGMVFILGAMVPMSYARIKEGKTGAAKPNPQTGYRPHRCGKKDKKDAPAAATEQKSPAAPEQKAVTADQPAPADKKAQDTKKTKKTKKSKKTKTAPKE